MIAMTEITCDCGCNRTRKVRTADIQRGWGRFYDKACKQRFQEERKKIIKILKS